MNTLKQIEQYKYLIFDFDETLVRLNADWEMQVKHLKELYPDVVKAYPDTVGKNSVNYIAVRNAIVEYYGNSVVAELQKITQGLEEQGLKSIDYNFELINYISAECGKKPMYIWSGNCTLIISRILGELGILKCFKNFVTQDTVAMLKPNPEGFNQIYVPGTQTTDYVLIGDSVNDEAAARAAGIGFFKIDYFKK